MSRPPRYSGAILLAMVCGVGLLVWAVGRIWIERLLGLGCLWLATYSSWWLGLSLREGRQDRGRASGPGFLLGTPWREEGLQYVGLALVAFTLAMACLAQTRGDVGRGLWLQVVALASAPTLRKHLRRLEAWSGGTPARRPKLRHNLLPARWI